MFEHKAAVKALAWSPHVRGLLVSGSGSTDPSIRSWNTLNGTMLDNVYCGSQVLYRVVGESPNDF
jgi:cell division cycle 20-like protein 1 (cofactor of APC complex)